MSSLNQKLTAIVVPVLLVASFAHGATIDAPSGQWTGNSQVDGDRSTSKTVLSLGAPDAENATLRIQGNTTCTLKQGSYAANGSGGWTLSFKEPSAATSAPGWPKVRSCCAPVPRPSNWSST